MRGALAALAALAGALIALPAPAEPEVRTITPAPLSGTGHPMRGRVVEDGNARSTGTRRIDPESFPDLDPDEWPSGRDVLARRDARDIVTDVLAQAWPAEITRPMLDDPDATPGFLVWDEVLGLSASGDPANKIAQQAVVPWYGWVLSSPFRPLPAVEWTRTPSRSTNFAFIIDDVLFDVSG